MITAGTDLLPARHRLQAVTVFLLLAAAPVLAMDDEAWLEDDWEARAMAVSGGELRFLPAATDKPVLNTRNQLKLTGESLESGWVELHQCQSNLDAVSRVELVYRYRGIRNLEVVRSRNIGLLETGANSVDMTDVGQDAEVCISAEVRVLERTSRGWRIESGPFHRRFLDGYYPLHLQYVLEYPPESLQIVSVAPAEQAGLEVRRSPGILDIDTWFEGRLTLVIQFQAPAPPAR